MGEFELEGLPQRAGRSVCVSFLSSFFHTVPLPENRAL
jgi:hypothetical protein